MMMRLRCTEKLQLIATADPPSPLFRLHSSPLSLHVALFSPLPTVWLFALMSSKWNSLSPTGLCCDRPLHRLIYWSIECTMKVIQVCSSLFKSIHTTMLVSESSPLSISTSISLINRDSIGQQVEYEVRQLIKQWMLQWNALKARAHESYKWKKTTIWNINKSWNKA